jgi:hypothetical protein
MVTSAAKTRARIGSVSLAWPPAMAVAACGPTAKGLTLPYSP